MLLSGLVTSREAIEEENPSKKVTLLLEHLKNVIKVALHKVISE